MTRKGSFANVLPALDRCQRSSAMAMACLLEKDVTIWSMGITLVDEQHPRAAHTPQRFRQTKRTQRLSLLDNLIGTDIKLSALGKRMYR